MSDCPTGPRNFDSNDTLIYPQKESICDLLHYLSPLELSGQQGLVDQYGLIFDWHPFVDLFHADFTGRQTDGRTLDFGKNADVTVRLKS